MKEIIQQEIQKEVGGTYCPVCETIDVIFIREDNHKKYYECSRCGCKWEVPNGNS